MMIQPIVLISSERANTVPPVRQEIVAEVNDEPGSDEADSSPPQAKLDDKE